MEAINLPVHKKSIITKKEGLLIIMGEMHGGNTIQY